MLSRGEEKRIRALHRRRAREREGRFLAEGVRVVEELLEAGIVLRGAVVSSTLEDTDRGGRLRERLEAVVETSHVGDTELRRLAGTTTTQGVLVVADTPQTSLAEIVAVGVVLVLDGVQDPGNLGTLARSAAAFGCGALIALRGTVDPWNPKAVRASAGALFRIPVVTPSLAELDEWLGRHGYLLAGADAGGPALLSEPLPQRVALAVGNEGSGLSEIMRDRADRLVSVPMRGGTESLNVAVAGAILLYELMKERS